MKLIEWKNGRYLGLFWIALTLEAFLMPYSIQAADLTVDGGATYTLNDPASIVFANENVGYSGIGTFNQNGGSNSATNLNLGYNTGASGTYNLSGGSLGSTTQILGVAGDGKINQTGFATNNASYLYVGHGLGCTGTYNLSGGSNIVSILAIGYNPGSTGTYNQTFGSLFSGHEYLGWGGTGVFNHSGGNNLLSGNLYLGYLSIGNTGTYNLSGGMLSSMNEYVGTTGTGIFNQSGGTHYVNDSLNLGFNTGSRGTYNLSAGFLDVSSNEYIGNSGTGTFTQTGGNHSVGTAIYIGYSNGFGTYNLSGGSLYAPSEHIGYYGTGIFNQTGGTNSVGAQLRLGYENGGYGYYTLQKGILSAPDEYIGNKGTGIFNQEGGINSFRNKLYIGYESGSSGTYNLNSGQLTTDQPVAQTMEFIGYRGTGTFNQSSGNHVSRYVYLGYEPTGSGLYNLSNGSMSTFQIYIGNNGNGIFNHYSGVLFGGDLFLGYESSGNGTYNLSGGCLSYSEETIGLLGTGTFNQSGGSNISSNIFLGYGSRSTGTYNLSGGTLLATQEYIGNNGTGIFNQSGGTNSVTSLGIGSSEVGIGLYNMSGGTLQADSITIINGAFNQTDGAVDVAGIIDNQGSIFLGGTIKASQLINESSGLLYGAGTLTGSFLNKGTCMPSPTGAMSISGSYTQTASGILISGIGSSTDYGRLNISGAANLGGTFQPVLIGGYIPDGNRTFSIITASGGVYGTFDPITDLRITPTLFWEPLYKASSFDLKVVRSYTNSDLGLSPNLMSLGSALNSVGSTSTGGLLAAPESFSATQNSDLNTVLNAIDHLPTAATVPDAFQQISAEKVNALPTLAFASANVQKQALARRITDLRFDKAGGGALSALPNYLEIGAGSPQLSCEAMDMDAVFKGARGHGTHTGIYLEPAGIFGSRSSSADQTGFDYTIAGFTIGADYRVMDDLLVGLASGYSHTDADFHGSGGNVSANTWPLTLYGAYLPEPFYVYASAGYALNAFDLRRDLIFGGIVRRAKSSPDGDVFNAYTEAGYDIKLSGAVISPMASLAYSKLWVGSFAESGADSLNLRISPGDADSLQTGVGARIALPFQMSSYSLIPQVYGTWQHDFSDTDSPIDARLSLGGPTFTFVPSGMAKDFAVLGADITLATCNNLKFRIDYNAEVARANSAAHYISGGMRWEF